MNDLSLWKYEFVLMAQFACTYPLYKSTKTTLMVPDIVTLFTMQCISRISNSKSSWKSLFSFPRHRSATKPARVCLAGGIHPREAEYRQTCLRSRKTIFLASKVAFSPVRGAGYEPAINWLQSQREAQFRSILRVVIARLLPPSIMTRANDRPIDQERLTGSCKRNHDDAPLLEVHLRGNDSILCVYAPTRTRSLSTSRHTHARWLDCLPGPPIKNLQGGYIKWRETQCTRAAMWTITEYMEDGILRCGNREEGIKGAFLWPTFTARRQCIRPKRQHDKTAGLRQSRPQLTANNQEVQGKGTLELTYWFCGTLTRWNDTTKQAEETGEALLSLPGAVYSLLSSEDILGEQLRQGGTWGRQSTDSME